MLSRTDRAAVGGHRSHRIPKEPRHARSVELEQHTTDHAGSTAYLRKISTLAAAESITSGPPRAPRSIYDARQRNAGPAEELDRSRHPRQNTSPLCSSASSARCRARPTDGRPLSVLSSRLPLVRRGQAAALHDVSPRRDPRPPRTCTHDEAFNCVNPMLVASARLIEVAGHRTSRRQVGGLITRLAGGRPSRGARRVAS